MQVPVNAVRALLPGCAHLNKPPELAAELAAFLVLRHKFQTDEISPGTDLDELWHHMLLNTRMAETVRREIGLVHHSTTGEADDHELMLRRLHAMNCLEASGYTVSPQLWQQPGSVMASIHLRGTGFATEFCTRDDRNDLVERLILFNRVMNNAAGGVKRRYFKDEPIDQEEVKKVKREPFVQEPVGYVVVFVKTMVCTHTCL